MAAVNVSLPLTTEAKPGTGITPAKQPAGLGIDVSGTAPTPALALDTAVAALQPPQAHPSNSPLSVIATNSPPLELEPFPQYPPSGVSGWLMRTFARRSATKEMEDFKRRNTHSVTRGLDAVAAGSSSTSASTLRRVRFNDPTATAFFAPPTPEVPPPASVSSFDFSDEPRALVQKTPGNELSAKGHAVTVPAGGKPAGMKPAGKEPAAKEDAVKEHGWWPLGQYNDGKENAGSEKAGKNAGRNKPAVPTHLWQGNPGPEHLAKSDVEQQDQHAQTPPRIQGDPVAVDSKEVAGGVVSDDGKKSAKNAPPPADPSDLGALMLFMMTMPFLGVATYVGTVEAMGYAIRVTAEGRGAGLLFPPRARPAVMVDGASDPRPKEKRRKRTIV